MIITVESKEPLCKKGGSLYVDVSKCQKFYQGYPYFFRGAFNFIILLLQFIIAVFQEALLSSQVGLPFYIPGIVSLHEKAGKMNASGSYVVVEYMIREKKVMMIELKHLVESLERRGLITPVEHQELLRLGKKLLPNLPTGPI